MANSRDVARAAGTSQATVSRVFRGLPTRPGVTERVRAAAQELGYRPSGAARALISGRSRQIALVVETLNNPYFAALADAVHALLRPRGYRLSIVTSDPGAHGLVDHADEAFESVDAIMYASVDHALPVDEVVAARGKPALFLVRTPANEALPTVSPRHAEAAELAVEHLWGLGHRRFAMVGATSRLTTGIERAAGFRAALDRRGIPAADVIVDEGELTYDSGLAQTRALLATAPSVTAIVGADDLVAFGACAAVAERGLRLGIDVSVVGIDNLAMSAWPTFDLTTVDVQWETLVRHAVDSIIASVDGTASPKGVRRIGTPTLVERRTSGPAPALA